MPFFFKGTHFLENSCTNQLAIFTFLFKLVINLDFLKSANEAQIVGTHIKRRSRADGILEKENRVIGFFRI